MPMPSDTPQCLACEKLLRMGLYNEPESLFCNTVCATWFARAVAHVIYIDGDGYRKIDNWLLQYTQIRNKRGLS